VNDRFSISKAHKLLTLAAVDKGELGQKSFRQWEQLVKLTDVDHPSQIILPAIIHQLSDDKLSIQIRKLAKFRRLRSQTFLEAGFRAELALRKSLIPVAWIKGGAVIARTSSEISNRPMDDIGLLVHSESAEQAARVLQEAGFRPTPYSGAISASLRGSHKLASVEFSDPAGAKISLHWQQFKDESSHLLEAALWTRISGATLLGRSTTALSSQDLFLQVISTREGGLQAYWVLDAIRLLEDNNMDFRKLAEIARERRLWMKYEIALIRLALYKPDLVPLHNRYLARILDFTESLFLRLFRNSL
jgi:hypothetical protein